MDQSRQDGSIKPRIRIRTQGRYVNSDASLFDSEFERELPREIRAELLEAESPCYIISGDKLQFRAGQKPAGGHHPLQRPRRAVTHLRLAIGQRSLTERAGFTGTLFITQQPYHGLRPIGREPPLIEPLSSRPSAF